MKILPKSDVCLSWGQHGVEIDFCRVPDREVANTVFSVTENPGIKIEDNAIPYSLSGVTSEIERQRLHYWVAVSSNYDCEEVAQAIANELRKDHNLTVRVCKTNPDDGQENIVVQGRA